MVGVHRFTRERLRKMADPIVSYVKKVKATAKRKGQPAKASGKKYLIWSGIIVFVSAWMFVLGILVGRGTAPVHFDMQKLQNELVALKEAVLKKERKRYSVQHDTFGKGQELGFYEALKETGDASAVSQEIIRPKKRKPRTQPAIIQPRFRKRTASVRQEPKSKKKLAIQVASLKDPRAADKMVAKFKRMGYPAYRVIGKIPNRGIWHRVRIGSYPGKSQAKKMLITLRKDKVKGIIVDY